MKYFNRQWPGLRRGDGGLPAPVHVYERKSIQRGSPRRGRASAGRHGALGSASAGPHGALGSASTRWSASKWRGSGACCCRRSTTNACLQALEEHGGRVLNVTVADASAELRCVFWDNERRVSSGHRICR